MGLIFKIVYNLLVFISRTTGFTYKEINIIVYYIVVPFVFIALLDKIFKMHYLKIAFVTITTIAFFCVKDFNAFSNWMFDRSVDFLLSFGNSAQSYIVSSVIICVVVPMVVFALLFYLAFKEKLISILKLRSPNKS